MTPKRGQPPKPPEERKTVHRNVSYTESQIADVDAAKQIEAPDKKFSAYIRDMSLEHAQKVLENAQKAFNKRRKKENRDGE